MFLLCVCVRVVDVCKYVHEYLKIDVQICIHTSMYTIYSSISMHINIYIYIYTANTYSTHRLIAV